MDVLKVLLLEDNENDMELIQAELLSSLEYQFNFKWVITKSDFIKELNDFKADIILSDYKLPQFNGIDALKLSIEVNELTPFILVTGNLPEETAADSIKEGAWDFVVKDRLHRLPVAIQNALKLKVEKQKKLKAELELQLIKEKLGIQFKLLYDAIERAPSSVVITDYKSNILYVNNEFEKVTGYKREEAVGKNPSLLKSGKQDSNFYKRMWDSLLDGKEWKGTFINKKKNGELYWEQASIAAIHDSDGELVNFVAIKHDITELIKAKEAAEESSRLKSTFLATISHELRTPLNIILGFSSLIDETYSVPEILEMVKTINDKGNTLLEIVESIIDISMLKGKEVDVTKEYFYLSEAFEEINNYLKNEITKQNKNDLSIEFIPEPNTSELKINTDKKRLIQLFSNLLNNALKFTEKGSIEYGYLTTKNNITFFVKDTGIGIPENKTEIIFDLFRQIDDKPSRKYGGLGIGLALSKEIVSLLNGSLWVESEYGKGSIFYIYLPQALK